MTSESIRDPLADHLITPQNCSLVIIDYEPTQISSIKSMDDSAEIGPAYGSSRVGSAAARRPCAALARQAESEPKAMCVSLRRLGRTPLERTWLST
jgi:hypothetical protein